MAKRLIPIELFAHPIRKPTLELGSILLRRCCTALANSITNFLNVIVKDI